MKGWGGAHREWGTWGGVKLEVQAKHDIFLTSLPQLFFLGLMFHSLPIPMISAKFRLSYFMLNLPHASRIHGT